MAPSRGHLPSLDGLRGVAVCLVIASHSFRMVPALPWTVKRFSNLGFYGVQLFFVVSAVTLAMSWHNRQAGTPPSLRSFALRRLFRIAPAYYVAAILYAVLMPHSAISPVQALTFVTFTDGWSPALMPTIPDAWVSVPGGWSVQAEFAFYAIFPILIAILGGIGRALLGLAVSLPFAWVANSVAAGVYTPNYGPIPTDQFLYYWLPNQLPVFLCGFVAYEVIVACRTGGRLDAVRTRIAQAGPAVLAVCLLAFLALAVLPWPRLAQPGHAFVPVHVIAAVAFGTAVIVSTCRTIPVLESAFVTAMGRASFSAYLLHFAVIAGYEQALPHWVFSRTGMSAVMMSTALFLLVLITTGCFAQVTFRFIETPGMRLGSRLIATSGRASKAAKSSA